MEHEDLSQYSVHQQVGGSGSSVSQQGQGMASQSQTSAQPSSAAQPTRQQLANAIISLQTDLQTLTTTVQSLVAAQQSSSQSATHVASAQPTVQQSQPQAVSQAQATHLMATTQATLLQAHVKLERPQNFSGNPAELLVWKFKLREYVDSCGLQNANDQARFAVSLLVGKALIWWMDWSQTAAGDLQNLVLDDLLQAMDDQFADVDRERRLQARFDNLVQRGSVQQYAAAHRHLRLQLGHIVSETNALYKFVEGLKPVIRKDVLLAQPDTVTEAIMAAERSEVANFFVSSKQLHRTLRPAQSPRARTYHPREYGNPNIVPMELGTASSSRAPPAPRVRETRQCHYCGKSGHLRSQCYKLKNDTARAKKLKLAELHSFEVHQDDVEQKYDLLGVTGHVNNQQVRFLIDSGATNNFISFQDLEKLEQLYEKSTSNQQVRLADGKIVKIIGSTLLAVMIGSVQVMLQFSILPCAVPVILGMPFLVQLNPRINWEKREMQLTRGSRKLTVQLQVYTRNSSVSINSSQQNLSQQPPSNALSRNPFYGLELDDTSTPIHNNVELNNIVDNNTTCGPFVRRSVPVKVTSRPQHLVRSIVTPQQRAAESVLNVMSSNHIVGCPEARVLRDCDVVGGVDKCFDMYFQAKQAGFQVKSLTCPTCCLPVLDEGEWCAKMHKTHKCNFCEKIFTDSEYSISNPINRLFEKRVFKTVRFTDEFDVQQKHVFKYDKRVQVPMKRVARDIIKKVRFQDEIDEYYDFLVKNQQIQQNINSESVQAVNNDSVENEVSSGDADFVDNTIELVNFRQFYAAGKKQLYDETFCLMMQDVTFQQQCNFTHRASFGTLGEGDVHGDLQNVATEFLAELKIKFPTVFEEPKYPVVRENNAVDFYHYIKLKDPSLDPPKRRLYPLDATELEELKKQINELLADNRIVPSSSPYGAPILFARKKNGKLRMCIDYRMLNNNTIRDTYPLPRTDELLQRVGGCSVFSKIDLNNAYHQLPMFEDDKFKTAFTCRYGTFEFNVMPFGLMNAPSTFQRVMNNIFMPLLDSGVLVYMDDILVYSKDVLSHKKLLSQVFDLLQQNQLYVKEEKCSLFLESVEFLGHRIDKYGIHVEQGKIDAIVNWPVPTCLKEVQQFLGLCNYYRKFITRFSEIASPLTGLTRKNIPFCWNEQQQKSFQLLKSCLSSAPVLRVFDPALETRITCDASDFCIGAILEQKCDDQWHPCEYFSKRLNQAERNYSATEREFVAIRASLERWRHFLVSVPFVVFTDHASLTYLQKQAHLSRRNARWLDFLSQFDFTIQHVAGRSNVADFLSRIPGMESLSIVDLCSMVSTCGITHVCDVMPVQTCSLNSVISVYDDSTLLKNIRRSQQTCNVDWYLKLVQSAAAPHVVLNDVGTSSGQLRDAQSGDGVTFNASRESQKLQYRDGVLCRLHLDHFCPIVVDHDQQQQLMSDLHSSALGGHLSRKKLFKSLQKRFYWKNMFQSVAKFCKECSTCQANRVSTQKPVGLLMPLQNPCKPFEHVTMDFVTHLPKTVNGNDAIFSIIDRFSKLCMFIPMSGECSALDCANLFFKYWVCQYGMPVKIISDRDTRFTSKFWQCLMKLLDCKVAVSSSYHPQTDGLTERFHRSIEQVLRNYVLSDQSNWDVLLPQCSFALNSTVHASTSVSPFRCIYGFDVKLPLDAALQQLQDVEVQSVSELVSARSKVHTQVQQHLQASTAAMARYANRHRRDMDFHVGELVWLRTDHLQLPGNLTKKLAAKWIGPYKITEVVNPVAMRLQLPKEIKLHPVIHVSQLKKHEGAELPATQPVFSAEDGQVEYEVEQIVGHRLSRGKYQFLVKWVGYPSYENTWEPENNLENSKRLLNAYKKQHNL